MELKASQAEDRVSSDQSQRDSATKELKELEGVIKTANTKLKKCVWLSLLFSRGSPHLAVVVRLVKDFEAKAKAEEDLKTKIADLEQRLNNLHAKQTCAVFLNVLSSLLPTHAGVAISSSRKASVISG